MGFGRVLAGLNRSQKKRKEEDREEEEVGEKEGKEYEESPVHLHRIGLACLSPLFRSGSSPSPLQHTHPSSTTVRHLLLLVL